jgi:carboxypeptidase C (cathepsin A)
MGSFDARDNFDYSGAVARTLEAGVPVTFYFGKTDTACNYVGGQALVESISWSGQQDFGRTEYTPLIIAGATVGQVKKSGGLSLFLVESAGHMV